MKVQQSGLGDLLGQIQSDAALYLRDVIRLEGRVELSAERVSITTRTQDRSVQSVSRFSGVRVMNLLSVLKMIREVICQDALDHKAYWHSEVWC